jgi:hypothetical protein
VCQKVLDSTRALSVPAQPGGHDHAWRRVTTPEDEPGLIHGRYHCELCRAIWAL